MKANEAPKKIWVHELSAKELNVPLKEYHIEYTRTDAFIEKAVERMRHYLNNSAWVSNDVGVREKEVIIADFVNYLKGE